MNIRHIQFLLEAEDDLVSGRLFYDGQEQGIGEYFWDSILSDIESLFIFAGIHAEEYGFYRMPSKRFPYSIYYNVISILNITTSISIFQRNIYKSTPWK